MRNQNHEKGMYYEKLACEYLTAQGCIMLEQNFRSRFGEIDLIVRDGEYLVFVEVKYRKNGHMGLPYEAVGSAKQRQIIRTSDYYRLKNGIDDFHPMRYDVVSICGNTVEWIKNAFDYRNR